MGCGCKGSARPETPPARRLAPLRAYELGTLDASGGWANRGTMGAIVFGPPQLLGVFDCEPHRPHDDEKVGEALAAVAVPVGSPILRVRVPRSTEGGNRSTLPPGIGLELWVGGLDTFGRQLWASSTWAKGGGGSLDPTTAELGVTATELAQAPPRAALMRAARPVLDVLPYAHRADAAFDLRALAGGSRYIVAYWRAVETGGYPFVGRCSVQFDVIADEPGPQVWRDVWHGVGYVDSGVLGHTTVPPGWDNWSGDPCTLIPTCAGVGRVSFINAGDSQGWVVCWQQAGALARRDLLYLDPAAYQLQTSDLGTVAGVLRLNAARDQAGAGVLRALAFASVVAS